MQSAKQKMSDMASTAKEKIVICQAKANEKAEQATARTKEEKEIAHERRKAKEAEAKMDMHLSKAAHAEEKLMAKQSHYHVTHGHATTPAPVMGHGYGPNPTTPAPVMGQGYGSNPTGVASVPPPHAYHPTGNRHFGNDLL